MTPIRTRKTIPKTTEEPTPSRKSTCPSEFTTLDGKPIQDDAMNEQEIIELILMRDGCGMDVLLAKSVLLNGSGGDSCLYGVQSTVE